MNTTSEDGCNLYTCSVNSKGDLVLHTKVTTCPPFNRQACLDQGVQLTAFPHLHLCICHTFVLNLSLCLAFRGKSAGLEQPAARSVRRVVSPARLVCNFFFFFKTECSDVNTIVCMCEGTEPECRRTMGTLNYIKVDDCRSENQIELHYCEVKDSPHTDTHTPLIHFFRRIS